MAPKDIKDILDSRDFEQMKPQYPIEPDESAIEPIVMEIKEIDFYDGRKLCTDDRRIREIWGYAQIHQHDPEIVLHMARALAWYRGTPVTAMIRYDNGFIQTIVSEPGDNVEDVIVRFVRYLPSERRAHSSITTTDLKRVHNRIMDLQMQEGEFSVGLMVKGTNQPFFTNWYANDAPWKLLGPNRTKTQVDQDLLKNFNDAMEAISREVNGAKGSSYVPTEGVYVFWVWDVTLHEANIERVKRAVTSTGWTVVSLETNIEGIKLVIK